MKPYLNNVTGKASSDIITLQGGLNTCYDKSSIRDNQLPFMWNVAPLRSPTLSTRTSRMSLAWAINDTNTYATGKPLALFVSSSKTLYEIEESELIAKVYKYVPNNGYYVKTYVGDVELANNYYICECRDANNIYIIISTDTTRYKYTEGGALTPYTDYYGIVAGHKNRLWIASDTSVKFSHLRQYDNFTIDSTDPINTAGEINITNAKGRIVALVPYDGKLIVFCERSWHVIYGSSPNADVDQFYLVDMNDGLGCISHNTYTICDRCLYWIDTDFSVYKYNGASVLKVSEPYGVNANYVQYGGIKNLTINKTKLNNVRMGSYDTNVYIILTRSLQVGALNDTALVYDTAKRVWWAEDGAFNCITRWDTDTTTTLSNRTDYLVAGMYNGDLLILNFSETGYDTLFNKTTRDFDQVDIQYAFETKTWLLGNVKHKKTLTDVWWQANAHAKVGVCDNWTDINPWNTSINSHYIILGELNKASAHDVESPTKNYHEGTERQRFIVPKMYLQKVNAFSIRVEGEGDAQFYLLEKEWRIR